MQDIYCKHTFSKKLVYNLNIHFKYKLNVKDSQTEYLSYLSEMYIFRIFSDWGLRLKLEFQNNANEISKCFIKHSIFTKGFCKYLNAFVSNCTSIWTVFIGFPILPDTLYIFLCLARFPARYLPFLVRFSPETWFLTKFRRGNFQNTRVRSIYSHNALIFHCGELLRLAIRGV